MNARVAEARFGGRDRRRRRARLGTPPPALSFRPQVATSGQNAAAAYVVHRLTRLPPGRLASARLLLWTLAIDERGR
jgi:hypothetical protein